MSMMWRASGANRRLCHLSGKRIQPKEIAMTYRVYSGPPGSEAVPPMEKDRWLYKEFGLLDEALSWARHVNKRGRVALLIEGDNGVSMNKFEIAAAVQNDEAQPASPF
jgi:hypothetical protein